MSSEKHHSSRRDFLTGKALRGQAEQAGDVLADALTDQSAQPQRPPVGDTVRLQTRAMACDFAVILNPDPGEQIPRVSDALDLVHPLEQQMTVYREESELSEINRRAFAQPVPVEPQLFDLLCLAKRIAEDTGGAFDPTSGPVIALWRRCREEGRIPKTDELNAALRLTGIEQVQLTPDTRTVRFLRDGLAWDLGGIGKGYALDRIAGELEKNGTTQFLLHGGHSSLLARGTHSGGEGWPVGIRNPLFPKEQLAVVVLKNQALSSSGSGVQFFRHEGKRYGHILDPRSGQPSEGMLSVTVLAPTAAEADALSTAFFVMGLEKARAYCDNREEVGAVLIAEPNRGRSLDPILCNIAQDCIFFDEPT